MADPVSREARSPLVANPVSIAGAWITTLAAFAFLTFIALEAFGLMASPYAGLFGFILVPLVFVGGLVLIPIGIAVEARRRRAGRAAWAWPVIDLGQSRTRNTVLGLTALTLVNVAIVVVASTGAAHYSESNTFCGQVCHEPMEPQFVNHKLSAHAQIECVQCHVAPGASGAIAAKMNGTRQLYGLLTNTFQRPIPSPRDRMPVPTETCTQCHAPVPPDREVKQVLSEHKDNETSSEILTTLVHYTGKNHWHARPDVVVEYAATDDSATTIPYVKVTQGGTTTEYFAEDVTAPPAGRPLRRMDCLDCHNRPAHTMASTPGQVVDRAINRGEISTAVPFVRSEMVDALSAEYPEGTNAAPAVVERLQKVFGTATPEARQAVAVAERLYRENVFPKMKVNWGTYKSNLTHVDDTGCFRCHTDRHTVTGDPDKKVRQDCELCHKEE
jgi:hypothetical protein